MSGEVPYRRVIIICLDENDVVQEVVEADKAKLVYTTDIAEIEIYAGDPFNPLLQKPVRRKHDITINIPGGKFSVHMREDQKALNYQRMLGEANET